MKRFLVCLAVFLGVQVGVASAQSSPNCNQQNAILTSASTGPNYNATSIKCVAWTFSYFSQGFSVVSIQVEFAPDVAGVPGAFSVIPGVNITAGTNPLTSLVSGTMTINGYFPWLRVNLVTATGTGSVNYTLIGNSYVGPASSVTTVSGGATTVTAKGPDAPGVPPTLNPVQDSGFDGTNVQRIRTDTTGRTVVVGPTSKNTAETGNPVWIAGTDGATERAILTDTGGRPIIVASIATAADGINTTNIATLQSGANSPLEIAPFVYNGNNAWDRERSASLADFPTSVTLTARNTIGAQLVEKTGRFFALSNPAAGSQATASIAAEASVRHVIDCLSFAAFASGATAQTPLTLNVRDGATGAGTLIYTVQLNAAILAAGGTYAAPHSVCGLNLVGTTNTAMTVEFSAALANLLESVSWSGYNVN